MKIINCVALKYLLLVNSSAFLSLPEIKMLALAGKTQGKTNEILGATAGSFSVLLSVISWNLNLTIHITNSMYKIYVNMFSLFKEIA